jgi:hypothetical protein
MAPQATLLLPRLLQGWYPWNAENKSGPFLIPNPGTRTGELCVAAVSNRSIALLLRSIPSGMSSTFWEKVKRIIIIIIITL